MTGSAQGLGAALARDLHDRGCNVVLADLDGERNEATADEIGVNGGRVQALHVDMRDSDAVERAFQAAVARWGSVELLVNNAAVTDAKSVWEITPQEWDDVLAVNLRGVFVLTRLAGVHMRELGYGRIVNIASLAGQAPRPSGAHYAASKAGLIALTRNFAVELAPHGVTVNAIAPAIVDTPMVRSVDAAVLDRLVASIPVGRICRPDEVAALAAFLLSEQAGYITGATYDINGGVLMR